MPSDNPPLKQVFTQTDKEQLAQAQRLLETASKSIETINMSKATLKPMENLALVAAEQNLRIALAEYSTAIFGGRPATLNNVQLKATTLKGLLQTRGLLDEPSTRKVSP